MDKYIIAVDVGTGSARAGVFNEKGNLLARQELPIKTNKPLVDYAEQSSEDIWSALCMSVKKAVKEANIDANNVVALGFDATCSLVVRDKNHQPISVSPSGDNQWDTILWMDHRAVEEANECTKTNHEVLNYIGDTMSPEMETPKLMWLKRNLPETWKKSGLFFDLADFLTWRATGSLARSQCTLTCKWTYLSHEENPWKESYLDAIGLEDLLSKGNLPQQAKAIGKSVGQLTEQAASELGLSENCVIASGLIDAHAGAISLLGFHSNDDSINQHLALIAGTSSCMMSMSNKAIPTKGVWGPYYGAVMPLLWLNEGGQSVSGALLDHILSWLAQGGEPSAERHQKVIQNIQQLRLQDNGSFDVAFASEINIIPDFHGNRSPLADAKALGVISGLNMDNSFNNLCKIYWRCCVAIALGVRHTLDELNKNGYAINHIHLSGGHIKNPLLMELYADATDCTLHWAADEKNDSVLLGAAMNAAAAYHNKSLSDICEDMKPKTQQRKPNPENRDFYNKEYKKFLLMHKHRQELISVG